MRDFEVGQRVRAITDGYRIERDREYTVTVVHPPFVAVRDDDGNDFGLSHSSHDGSALGNILASRFTDA
jgi:hypothetical protein